MNTKFNKAVLAEVERMKWANEREADELRQREYEMRRLRSEAQTGYERGSRDALKPEVKYVYERAMHGLLEKYDEKLRKAAQGVLNSGYRTQRTPFDFRLEEGISFESTKAVVLHGEIPSLHYKITVMS